MILLAIRIHRYRFWGIQMSQRHYSKLKYKPLTAAMAAVLALSAGNVHAQQAQDNDEEETSQSQTPAPKASGELDSVTVVGSRIKRSEVEGPSPVTIISAEQIALEGHKTVFEALSTLTQASGSTQNELFQSGFTPNASVINLRGLGPGRTLLLINGRRAADYPLPYNGQSNFANFGNIPSAAVERIEILSGGASAIYGSDAVAGVINVVLKTNYEGDSLKLTASKPERDGGFQTDLQWVGGKTKDNWSVTYAVQHYKRNPTFAYQRDFMDSLLDNPLPPDFVGIQPTGTMRLRNRTRSTNNYIAPPAGACEQMGGEWVRWNYRTANAAGVISNLGESCGSFKDVGYQTIQNKSNDLSAYLYGTLQLGNDMELWSSVQAWRSHAASTSGSQFWGGASVGQIWFDPQYNTYVDAQRVFTPMETGGPYSLMQKFKETSTDIAVGLRGTFGENFDWDATVSHARYDVNVDRPRLLANKINDWFLGPRLGTQGGYPVYRLNTAHYYSKMTPAEFAAVSTRVVTEAESQATQGSFVITGDLFQMPAGPVGFAASLEAAAQKYTLHADPRILPSYTGPERIYNLTGTGGGGERNRYAAGVEFSIPIFSKLTASLAGRYDRYDDITAVDDAKTWNAGLQWRPLDGLLVRGSYSTTFRAPDMHYVFAERSGSFSSVFDTRRCLESGRNESQCSSDPLVNYTSFGVRQGTTNLEEETGSSWTAGFVWDIGDSLSLSVDYYDIELEGVVSDITSGYILDGEAGCVTGLTRNRQPFTLGAPGSEFCNDMLSRVTRISAPGTTQDGQISEIRRGPINRAHLSTTGLDATLTYRLITERFGSLGWQLGYNHVLSQRSAQFKNDPIIDYRDDLGNFDFRSRVRSTWTWNRNDWDASLFMLRYGSLPNWQETGRIAPFFLWNAGVGKKFGDLKVSVGVNNLFDKLHPRDDGFNSYPYFWRAFSPIGRSYSMTLEYKFN